jgi:hypothetical protein
MSRPSLRPASRLRAVIVAGAVLGVSTLSGASSAQATANVVDNQATIWRIGGSAVTGSNPIPSGRTLTPVQLITSDPATVEGDGTALSGATPSFRIGRTRVPGTPAEQVTFRINGTVVATAVPDMRATSLQTDAGPVTAVVFTAGGVTYAMPRAAIGSATRTVAQSTVNTGTVGVLITHQYGLLPVGAQARAGTVFTQSTFDTTLLGVSTARYTVLDSDNVRRNASALGEELVLVGEPAPTYNSRLGTGSEVLATLTLRSGATVTVRALQFDLGFSYGSSGTAWMFERAALAAAGATITDVTQVISSTPSAHTLTWQDLGFDLA